MDQLADTYRIQLAEKIGKNLTKKNACGFCRAATAFVLEEETAIDTNATDLTFYMTYVRCLECGAIVTAFPRN